MNTNKKVTFKCPMGNFERWVPKNAPEEYKMAFPKQVIAMSITDDTLPFSTKPETLVLIFKWSGAFYRYYDWSIS